MTPWPELPYAEWKDTAATLQLWTQIVGKIRLAKTPWLNHSWHVTLYVTSRGLTTGPIPDDVGPLARSFEIAFDFIDHVLWVGGNLPLGYVLRGRPWLVHRPPWRMRCAVDAS